MCIRFDCFPPIIVTNVKDGTKSVTHLVQHQKDQSGRTGRKRPKANDYKDLEDNPVTCPPLKYKRRKVEVANKAVDKAVENNEAVENTEVEVHVTPQYPSMSPSVPPITAHVTPCTIHVTPHTMYFSLH